MYTATAILSDSSVDMIFSVTHADVLIMILVINFIFAAIGMIAFKANDPQHFGNLVPALMSIWQIETLDAWEVRRMHAARVGAL